MKVAVKLTVDIDVDAWIANYGVDRAEVRADVQEYLANDVREWLDAHGFLAKNETGK